MTALTPEEAHLKRRLDEAFTRGDQDEIDLIRDLLDAQDAERLARLSSPDALGQAARWYAGQGIAVFPLHDGAKTPRTEHGFKDATTDLHTVTAWWQRWPAANIGLPTGHRFDVVDIDPPDGWASLAEARDALPPTIARAFTPRGLHLYITPTGEGNGAHLMPGIDYRGLGGYVVAPPSRIDGALYLWVTPLVLG